MKALVLDFGLFPELALRLAREYDDEVGYFSPWTSTFPNPIDQLIGSGLEDFNVRRVDFPFELYDTPEEPDIWVFPDLLFSDWQRLLRLCGRQVWGAGWGELLELDRWKFHQLLEAAGWPVAATETVQGLEELERRLRAETDGGRWVKLSPYYRGLNETYEHRGWPASQSWLNRIRQKLGPRGADLPFMLQTAIPGEHTVEPGLDLLVRNGQILYPTLIGYEKKGSAIISKVIHELPPTLAGPVETIVAALSREEAPYNNFFSAELRVNDEGEAYFIDATARMPRPADGAHQELCENLGAIIAGEDEAPVMRALYAVQLMLDSPRAEEMPLHLSFPAELRQHLKLYQFYRDPAGEYWSLPRGISNIASVVVVGDDLEKIKQQCLEYAKEVKADSLSFEENAFDQIEEDIAQGRQNGVDF